MRPAQGNISRYTVGDIPATQAEIPAYLRRELDKIQAAINIIADGQLDVTTVAPAKPRDGMIRRADGTSWNPGSGQGVYCYYAGSWKFLG